MKYARHLLLIALIAVLVGPATANAADIMRAERLSLIQDRCTVLQISLDQLQRRDLVARTDHGRQYENLIRQIDAFDLRLRNNNMPTQLLDGPTAAFKTAVTAFRDAYIRYDDSMNALREVDCHTHTTDFAQLLEQTRVLRAAVGIQVSSGDNSLKAYREAMVLLQGTLPRPQSAEVTQ